MKKKIPICLASLVVADLLLTLPPIVQADDAVSVGSRRQLFVDQHLIGSMRGARQVLHHPVRRDIAIKPDHPWEQYGVSYMVTFRDGDRFRAWYRVDAAAFAKGKRRAMTAYAESEDGIHWRKPKLGIIEFNGSKDNNPITVRGAFYRAVSAGIYPDTSDRHYRQRAGKKRHRKDLRPRI